MEYHEEEDSFRNLDKLERINAIGQVWGPVDCSTLQGKENEKCEKMKELIGYYARDVMRLQAQAKECHEILEEGPAFKSRIAVYEECKQKTEALFNEHVETYFDAFVQTDSL